MEAVGLLECLRALVHVRLHRSSFSGVEVAIWHLDPVHFYLAQHLANEQASLQIYDPNPDSQAQAEQDFQARILPPRIEQLKAHILVLPPGSSRPTTQVKMVVSVASMQVIAWHNKQLCLQDHWVRNGSQLAQELSLQGKSSQAILARIRGMYQSTCQALWQVPEPKKRLDRPPKTSRIQEVYTDA